MPKFDKTVVGVLVGLKHAQHHKAYWKTKGLPWKAEPALLVIVFNMLVWPLVLLAAAAMAWINARIEERL